MGKLEIRFLKLGRGKAQQKSVLGILEESKLQNILLTLQKSLNVVNYKLFLPLTFWPNVAKVVFCYNHMFLNFHTASFLWSWYSKWRQKLCFPPEEQTNM